MQSAFKLHVKSRQFPFFFFPFIVPRVKLCTYSCGSVRE